MARSTSSRPAPLSDETLQRVARLLRVLAHPDRLRMVDLLLSDRLSVGEVADATGLAPHAVSQHLNQMRDNGILRHEREGRLVYYRVHDPHACQLIACIRQHQSPAGSTRRRARANEESHRE